MILCKLIKSSSTLATRPKSTIPLATNAVMALGSVN